MATPPFFYRGTTVNWPGNEVLQELRLTPTSEDPIVATLFALWSARFGEAIVQVCERRAVTEIIHPSNWRSHLEREVVVAVPPFEFTERFVVATFRAHVQERYSLK